MTDELNAEPIQEQEPEVGQTVAPLYGIGPFTLREVVLGGIWLVLFVISFFPVTAAFRASSGFQGVVWVSVWTSGLEWILTIGVPTAAVFLLALRRLSPSGIRRVGSLGIDQFAAVAFSVSATIWLTWLWGNVATELASGFWLYTWVAWVSFFVALAGVVFTVFAPFIPALRDDFVAREEIVAHRNARPVRPVAPRPARPLPVPQSETVVDASDADRSEGYGSEADDPYASAARGYESRAVVDATPEDASGWEPEAARETYEPAYTGSAPTGAHQAFWALAPEERDVVDERGVPIFRVGPTAWALVIEDRGALFVIRHEDGRLGYLHDVSGITRG